MSEQKILIVDDDAGLREVLAEYLGKEGFEVLLAAQGQAMREVLAEQDAIDLVILDLMMPGEDGLSLARWLNGAYNIPFIMLSARGDEVDRIIGLEVGADDYLTKPFNARELLARIRAVIRRHKIVPVSAGNLVGEKPNQNVRTFGGFCVNLEQHSLSYQNESVAITSGEFNLLRILLENPNKVMSRDTLLTQLKGYEAGPFDRSIDVRITRIRKKIEQDPSHPIYLRTVWGEGYMFTPNRESK